MKRAVVGRSRAFDELRAAKDGKGDGTSTVTVKPTSYVSCLFASVWLMRGLSGGTGDRRSSVDDGVETDDDMNAIAESIMLHRPVPLATKTYSNAWRQSNYDRVRTVLI